MIPIMLEGPLAMPIIYVVCGAAPGVKVIVAANAWAGHARKGTPASV